MRTDIHRPSAIVPGDYVEICYLPNVTDFGTAQFALVERERLNKHQASTGGKTVYPSGGSCAICGNVNALSHVVYYHEKANEYIRVGEDCARKMDIDFDDAKYSAFKRNLEDARRNVAGKAKAENLCIDNGCIVQWGWYAAEPANGTDERGTWWLGLSKYQQTAYDMISKLVRYGSLSEAQWRYLGQLPQYHDLDAVRKAQWAAQDAQRAATSTHVGAIGERREFTATVRFTKFFENTDGRYYSAGWTLTMMDDNAGNVLVWKGSGFGDDITRGSKITFKATVKDHSEYKGVKQTIVTRAKLVPTQSPVNTTPKELDLSRD
jgi:hypothetical protein